MQLGTAVMYWLPPSFIPRKALKKSFFLHKVWEGGGGSLRPPLVSHLVRCRGLQNPSTRTHAQIPHHHPSILPTWAHTHTLQIGGYVALV